MCRPVAGSGCHDHATNRQRISNAARPPDEATAQRLSGRPHVGSARGAAPALCRPEAALALDLPERVCRVEAVALATTLAAAELAVRDAPVAVADDVRGDGRMAPQAVPRTRCGRAGADDPQVVEIHAPGDAARGVNAGRRRERPAAGLVQATARGRRGGASGPHAVPGSVAADPAPIRPGVRHESRCYAAATRARRYRPR